jgi:hypothetical protein
MAGMCAYKALFFGLWVVWVPSWWWRPVRAGLPDWLRACRRAGCVCERLAWHTAATPARLWPAPALRTAARRPDCAHPRTRPPRPPAHHHHPPLHPRSYDTGKAVLLPADPQGQPGLLHSWALATGTVVLASTATYPLDVVRKRMVLQVAGRRGGYSGFVAMVRGCRRRCCCRRWQHAGIGPSSAAQPGWRRWVAFRWEALLRCASSPPTHSPTPAPPARCGPWRPRRASQVSIDSYRWTSRLGAARACCWCCTTGCSTGKRGAARRGRTRTGSTRDARAARGVWGSAESEWRESARRVRKLERLGVCERGSWQRRARVASCGAAPAAGGRVAGCSAAPGACREWAQQPLAAAAPAMPGLARPRHQVMVVLLALKQGAGACWVLAGAGWRGYMRAAAWRRALLLGQMRGVLAVTSARWCSWRLPPRASPGSTLHAAVRKPCHPLRAAAARRGGGAWPSCTPLPEAPSATATTTTTPPHPARPCSAYCGEGSCTTTR